MTSGQAHSLTACSELVRWADLRDLRVNGMRMCTLVSFGEVALIGSKTILRRVYSEEASDLSDVAAETCSPNPATQALVCEEREN